MHTEFWYDNLKQRSHLNYLDVQGRVLLERDWRRLVKFGLVDKEHVSGFCTR